jgi:hypothetical protein
MILPKVRDPRFVTIRCGGSLTDSHHNLLALCVWPQAIATCSASLQQKNAGCVESQACVFRHVDLIDSGCGATVAARGW